MKINKSNPLTSIPDMYTQIKVAFPTPKLMLATPYGIAHTMDTFWLHFNLKFKVVDLSTIPLEVCTAHGYYKTHRQIVDWIISLYFSNLNIIFWVPLNDYRDNL